MSISSRLVDGAGALFGLMLVVGLFAVGVAFFVGMASFSMWVLKWTFPAFAITLGLTVILLGPLALIPPARGFAAQGFDFASTLFTIILWLWGMAYIYNALGYLGVIGGLVFFGFGVIPLAMIVALIHGDWGDLGLFILMIALIVCTQSLFSWLAAKANARRLRLDLLGMLK